MGFWKSYLKGIKELPGEIREYNKVKKTKKFQIAKRKYGERMYRRELASFK